MVLTAMSWPLTLTPVDFNIPDIVRRCAPSRASASLTDRRMRHTHTQLRPNMEIFEEFYASQYRGRRVQWLVRTGEGPSAHELVTVLTITRVQHNLGKAEVRALCMQRRYEFTVTTHQLCILLQFNEHEDAITHATLSTATNMPENYLVRALKVRTRTRTRARSISISISFTMLVHVAHDSHHALGRRNSLSYTTVCCR